jgi:predicted Zn finger-like uncharacterized protein
MIIECPACQSRYRIREEKLPAGGGNIKCPNCAHVFFVARDGVPSTTSPPAPPVATPFSPDSDSNSWSQIPLGQASSPATLALTGASASSVLAAAAGAAPTPLPGPPVGSAPKKWKLRNAVGLVYDFTDTDQLVRWLMTKESHDGMQASDDGGTQFRELVDFAELRDVRPSRKTMMGMPAMTAPPPMMPSGDYGADVAAAAAAAGSAASAPAAATPSARADAAVMQLQAQARLDQARRARGADPAPPPKVDKPAPRPASGGRSGAAGAGGNAGRIPSSRLRRDDAESGQSNLLPFLGLLLIPVLTIAVLHFAGIINLRDFMGGNDDSTGLPAFNPERPEAETTATPTNTPIELTPQQQVTRLVELAGSALQGRDFDAAIGHLERAIFLAPERTELHCQLANLYGEAGRPAEQARAQAACDGPSEGSAPAEASAANGSAAPAEGSSPP